MTALKLHSMRILGTVLLAATWGLAATPTGAQSVYDFSTRTWGVDAAAYEGESGDPAPDTPWEPGSALWAGEVPAIASPGGATAGYSVGRSNRYGHHRFIFLLDEPASSVQEIELRWDGSSANWFFIRRSGATFYVWNWRRDRYEVVEESANTSSNLRLEGTLDDDLEDYLGGADENALVLLASSNDRRVGFFPLTLETDYVRARVTAVAGADRFAIAHDGAGVHCLAEAVTVTALDLSGTPVEDYAGTVALDTGTGSGSWLPGPGLQGVLDDGTPGDGVATYAFADADDGVASFLLDYRSGPPAVDVEVSELGRPLVRDDDTEGPLVFSPSGFTVTASALPNPPPPVIADPLGPQTAAVPFALHLAAYGQTPNDPTCGVIESYAGPKALAFWSEPVDPTAQLLPVAVDGTAIGASEGAATGVPVSFTAGRAAVVVRYDDVGRVRVALKDTSPTEPTGGIRGTSGDFVVRPADLLTLQVTRADGTPAPAASTPTGPVFVAAGEAFRAVVRAVDAEGDPTPSYGREAGAEGVRLEASTLIAPSGGRNGSGDDGLLEDGAAFAPVNPPGTFRATSLAWDEVGAIRLRARVADGSYLGTGDVVGSESGAVGRFVPHHFDVALDVPRLETACAAGGFSYVGQDLDFVPGFEPRLVATARSAGGTTTTNYTGPWMRMAAGDLTGLALADATGTLEPAAPAPPSVADLGAGRAEILFDAGPPFRFARGAPVAPFDAEVELSLEVRDADDVVHPGNPVRFGGTAPGSGIAWSDGAALRYGRLQFENAYGSELLDLAVPLHATYFDGASFRPHGDDVCTSLGPADLALGPVPAGLSTSASLANQPFVAGGAGLSLAAPGAGQTGFVDLRADLAGRTWLRGDWDGDGVWTDDPLGRATFGIHGDDPVVIHLRERY